MNLNDFWRRFYLKSWSWNNRSCEISERKEDNDGFLVLFSYMHLKMWFWYFISDLKTTKQWCGCSFKFLEDVLFFSVRPAFPPNFLNMATLNTTLHQLAACSVCYRAPPPPNEKLDRIERKSITKPHTVQQCSPLWRIRIMCSSIEEGVKKEFSHKPNANVRARQQVTTKGGQK